MCIYIYIHILPIYILYPSYTSSMDLPFPQALAFQQLLQLPCSKRRLRPRGAQALRRAVGGAGEGESKQTVEQEIQAEGREKNDLVLWINMD